MLSTILWEEHKMIPQEWQLELAVRQISVDPTALYLRLAVFRVKDWASSTSEDDYLGLSKGLSWKETVVV